MFCVRHKEWPKSFHTRRQNTKYKIQNTKYKKIFFLSVLSMSRSLRWRKQNTKWVFLSFQICQPLPRQKNASDLSRQNRLTKSNFHSLKSYYHNNHYNFNHEMSQHSSGLLLACRKIWRKCLEGANEAAWRSYWRRWRRSREYLEETTILSTSISQIGCSDFACLPITIRIKVSQNLIAFWSLPEKLCRSAFFRFS